MPDAIPRQPKSGPASTLTKREQEVLELLAFGLSNKEIAQRLRLGPRTVETHINHVLGKLNVPSRSHAVAEAGRAGLLGNSPANAPAYPLQVRPNNLPFQPTTLLGREQDLIDVKILLEGTRLLTLSGSGGVGKTRLALRIGVDLIGLYPDGVWFCDFSPISDASLVVSVVAHALGLREQHGHALGEAIVSLLKRKHALLIFDNCEHVLESSAELADGVLRACPDIRILVTSRQALRIRGELVHRVRSLALPDETTGLQADRAMRYGAIALFVDRALASDSRFTMTDDNAPVIAEICRRVDGIPLAIELAATRVNVVGVRSLAQGLDDRFRVLSAGSRTALPRQQTMRATIDWSHDLLGDAERRLFRRLGVFAGAWSLEGGQSICSDAHLDRAEVLDALSSLVEKSLIIAEVGTDARFRFLESTRAYALDRLEAAGERGDLVRRHAEWIAAFADAAGERLYALPLAQWWSTVAPELDNIRLALKWCIEEGNDVVLGSRILAGTAEIWLQSVAEGCRYAESGLARIDEESDIATAGRLHYVISRLPVGRRAVEQAQLAAAAFEALGNRIGLARALRELSLGLQRAGPRREAAAPAERSLTILEELGLEHSLEYALSLNRFGTALSFTGQVDQARSAFERAAALFDSFHDAMRAGMPQTNLAELEAVRGDAETALKIFTKLLPMYDAENPYWRSLLFRDLASCEILLGRIDDAAMNARLALREAERCHAPFLVALAVLGLAMVASRRGRADLSARLCGYATERLRAEGSEPEPIDQKICDLVIGLLREQLPHDQLAGLFAQGSRLSTDDVMALAQMV